jgi:hypothetical protein
MSVTRYLTIDAGTTFRLRVSYVEEDGTPIDLTGWRADLQFKDSPTDEEPRMVVSSESAEVNIEPAEGIVEAVVSASKTASIGRGKLYYGFRLSSPGGEVALLAKGIATFEPIIPKTLT